MICLLSWSRGKNMLGEAGEEMVVGKMIHVILPESDKR